MRVLVTGATGLIGSALARALTQAGHETWGLSRSAREPGAGICRFFTWNGVEALPPELLDGVEAVVHLAGESVAQGRWSKERKRRIRESRTLSTRGIVEGIARAKVRPKVLLAASTVGFYGNRGDELLGEDAPAGTDFLAEVCVAWEAESARARDLGLRVVQHRIGVVLAREGGAFAKMRRAFKLGAGGRFGSGEQFFPSIHLDDAVGLIAFALNDAAVEGPLNTVAPHPVRNRELTEALARVLHRPAFANVPPFALKLALGEMASALLAGQRVSAQKAIALGYAFAYPTLGNALFALTSSPD